MGDVTPLWAVMLFTFLNSIGSGVSNAGIFFLAESKFGFGKEQLLGMGLLYGVTYIPAAMLVGPLLRRLPAGHRWASPRTMTRLLWSVSIGLVRFAEDWTTTF